MKNKVGIGIILTLLAGGIGWYTYWFFTNYERRVTEIRAEVSPQARRNPFLAAERFLNRLGVEVESISGRDRLVNLPPDGDVLVVNNFGPDLPAQREGALLAWLNRGGHMIIVAREEWDEEDETSGDQLLARFGTRLHIDSSSSGEDEDTESILDEAGLGFQKGADYPPVEARFTAEDKLIKVAFNPHRTLEDSEDTATGTVFSAYGNHLLQYQVGDGILTILSDIRLLANDHIGEHDHALFLAMLVGRNAKVWLLYSSNMPSLVTLLWRAAPSLVVSFLLLVVLSLWRFTGRTGPLLTAASTTRRNMLEHLDASAAYAWRTDRAGRMFKASQNAIEQKWQRRHPTLGAMDRKARCEWIAEQTGMVPRAVDAALYGNVATEQDFIKVSAAQQKLAAGLKTK